MTQHKRSKRGPEANPYASPNRQADLQADRVSGKRLWKRLLCWSLYFYPLVMILLIYLSWGLTYWRLGRRPLQPDPIDFPADVLGFFGLLGLLLSPFLVPAGAIVASVLPSPGANSSSAASIQSVSFRTLMVVGYTLLLVLAWWFIFEDPYRAVYWLRD